MPNTYTLISSNTVGAGGVASVTFNSIPSTYTDLIVKASTRSSETQIYGTIKISFNGVTTNLISTQLYGTGSGVGSYYDSTAIQPSGNGANSTANTFSNFEMYIPNYTLSNYKSISIDNVQENNATAAYEEFFAGLWSSTAAITSITITGVSTLNQYSTFYLYGIKNS
jgi:hypothetical protein